MPIQKGLLFVLFCLSIAVSACRKDCFYNARVIKFDTNKCACCGGLVIEVDGKTYQAIKYPESISPEVRNEYPYGVNIKYTLREAGDGCSITDGLINIRSASF
ncbi:MAG: hypothetical protein IPP37_16785 [Saprospiraceae bacterium]|nr:hypothetical protein [Saprospiraceae bacterium]